MTTLQINNEYALVFGLSWLVLDPLDSKHERITALRESGARWKASFKRGGEENIGTIADIGAHTKKSKAISGAAQLAAMPQYAGRTVLLMLEDPGQDGNPGAVAVVALVNGSVSVDALLTPAQAEAERTKFEDLCEQANRELITCGDTHTIRPVDFLLTWADLLPKQISRFKRGAEFPVVPLKSQRASQYVAAAVLMSFVGFAGMTAYEKYEAYQKRERELAAARKVNPETLYAQATQALLAQPVVMLGDAIDAVKKRLGAIDTSFAGWRLTEVECNVNQCTLKWLRETGTFTEFAQQAPKDWTDIVYADDGSGIMSKLPLSIQAKQLPSPDSWISRKSFQEQEISKWQKLSDVQLQFYLSAANLEAVPPGIAPEVLQNSPNAIYASTWELRPGSGWYLANAVANAPSYVTFESMKLSVSKSEPTFEARGKVYVKS